MVHTYVPTDVRSRIHKSSRLYLEGKLTYTNIKNTFQKLICSSNKVVETFVSLSSVFFKFVYGNILHCKVVYVDTNILNG
jgi:hypothetical protein